MPLVCDWNKIENVNDLNWDTTQAIAFATMLIGMGSITEKNYREFYTRLKMYSNATSGTWDDLTLDTIKKRIGLEVNVNDITPLKWNKTLGRIIRDRVNLDLRQAKREEEE
tara:strand:- start:1133 stop:1465 length:333 start_codon:yes stop_codon:yes gene_type:complete